MKVLVTTVDLEKEGGVASYYAALRPHLDSQVEYFTVGARRGERDGPLAVIKRFASDYAALRRRIRQTRFDLVHLNPSLLPKALVRDGLNLLTAGRNGNRTLVFFRGWDTRTERMILRYFPALFRWVYFRAEAMVVLALAFKTLLEGMGYKGRIYVETTVVPEEVFGGANKGGLEREERGTREDFHILFLSRMDVGKGIEETLEAYGILRAKYPKVTLTMAGDGPALKRAKDRATQLGLADVDFPGFVVGEDKRRVFDAADIYLFPTYGEGMPNSVLEAMAYGLPVITRPVGGLKNFFEDGKMGFLTESLDPGVFAALLECFITDPGMCRRMGEFNRRYAYDHFRASKVADRLLKIYGDVIGSA